MTNIQERKTKLEAAHIQFALVDAVAAALPILFADRYSFLESNSVEVEGEPRMVELDDDARAYVAKYDRAIALCEEALKKAGAR